MMTLRKTLILIDELYDLPTDGENVPWYDVAIQDTLGGVDTGDFPMGSIFADEGRLLYALVRAMRPANVFELGIGPGCSGAHLLLALEHNNKGKLWSVDGHNGAEFQQATAHERRFTLTSTIQELSGLVGKSQRFDGKLRKIPKPDFIFEDTMHSPETSKATAEFALAHLKPGGFLVVHDAMHHLVGEDVRQGIKAGGITDMRHFLIDGTDTGVGVWQK